MGGYRRGETFSLQTPAVFKAVARPKPGVRDSIQIFHVGGRAADSQDVQLEAESQD